MLLLGLRDCCGLMLELHFDLFVYWFSFFADSFLISDGVYHTGY